MKPIIPFLFLLSACFSAEINSHANIYLVALTYIQHARTSQYTNNHKNRRKEWTLLDKMNQSLPIEMPQLLLRQVLEKFTLKHESILAMGNSLENFRGSIGVDPPAFLYESGPFFISLELLDALDSGLRDRLMSEVIVPGKSTIFGEQMLTKIEPPLKRIYFQCAYEHFKTYSSHLLTLSQPPYNVNSTDFLTVKNGSNPRRNLHHRMALVRDALSKCLKAEKHARSLLLCATWCLAQYLAYMSRLFPHMEKKIDYAINEFYNDLPQCLTII